MKKETIDRIKKVVRDDVRLYFFLFCSPFRLSARAFRAASAQLRKILKKRSGGHK